jgi:hypothetical protein
MASEPARQLFICMKAIAVTEIQSEYMQIALYLLHTANWYIEIDSGKEYRS